MDVEWPPRARDAGAEYRQYAEVYDLLFADLEQDMDFYLQSANALLAPGASVLELGVGTGRLTRTLLDAGYCATGVDVSAEMLSHAQIRLGAHRERCELVHGDVRSLRLDRRFRLAVAPYGMVAHLLSDADRSAAFRGVFAHLEPGGAFVFDDCPEWLSGPADDTQLRVWRRGTDAQTGHPVRLMSNTMRAAEEPLSVRYDIVDWLDAAGGVKRRMIVRVVFRNIALEDELQLLREAGFDRIELLGDFDGRAFDRERLTANNRLIVRCRRPEA